MYRICPSIMKRAKVTALHKGGSKSLPSNYRPISILPISSKLLERSVHTQLMKYVTENNILTEYQSGFRRLHSTATCMMNFLECITINIENKKVTGVVYLDFSKAFDTVDHEIPLKKLEKYGWGEVTNSDEKLSE